MAPSVPTTTRPTRALSRDVVRPPSRIEPARGAGSLGALVSTRAAALGERNFAEDARGDRVLSFAGLEQWRRTFAGGVFTPGTTVAVSIADPLSCAAAVLGAVAAGLWVAPLDPATPEEGPSGLDVVLARTGAQVVLADRAATPGCRLGWIHYDELAPSGREVRATAPVDAAGGIVLSSSGTTGPPKVARLAQSKLLHTARCVVAHHDLRAEDRCFNTLPLFHINAEVVALLSSLVVGSTLVLDDRFHRSGFWDLMAERHVTWINAVPAIIARLADLGNDEHVPPGVRFIRSASAPLSVVAADRFEERTGIPVVETYGMTEAASQITAHPLSVQRRAGSVGVAVGVELRIVDEGSADAVPRACGPAEVGEVEIRGPSVIDSYVGGTHDDRFRPGGWLRTGDLGWRDADGFVYLVARSDDVINRSGEKVFPREIEEAISADPDVLAVAVTGQSDPELGQVPVAFVVLESVETAAAARDAGTTIARINASLVRALVRTRRPVTLYVVSSLPRGATGKVRRRALFDADTPILHSYAGG